MSKRTNTLKFALTDRELDTLKRKANEKGLKIAEYIRLETIYKEQK